jgi:hypothetical protein
MTRPRPRRPSPAVAIALAALAVAVGGTALGAIAAIPSNDRFTACYQTSDELLSRIVVLAEPNERCPSTYARVTWPATVGGGADAPGESFPYLKTFKNRSLPVGWRFRLRLAPPQVRLSAAEPVTATTSKAGFPQHRHSVTLYGVPRVLVPPQVGPQEVTVYTLCDDVVTLAAMDGPAEPWARAHVRDRYAGATTGSPSDSAARPILSS